jgi:hypothetical protein
MLYTLRKSFDGSYGQSWLKYLKWLGRADLAKIVSLDSMLCGAVALTMADTDWQYAAKETGGFYTDADFVLERGKAFPKAMVLAAIADPSLAEVATFKDPHFVFAGYDLVDVDGIASALLNCGGFPDVFSADELSCDSGLIPSHERAFEIRDKLLALHPEDAHADCRVWALWQYEEGKRVAGEV